MSFTVESAAHYTEGFVDPEAAPPPPATMTGPRLFLLSVATLGIYLGVWTYRTARRFDPGQPRSKHVAWGAAVLCPPLYAFVLFELGRLINFEGRRLARTFGSSALAPALIHAGLAAALTLTSLDTLWTPLWLVLPLPALLVNSKAHLLARLEQDLVDGTARPPVARAPRWQLAVMVLGVPASLAAGYWLDRQDYRVLFRSALVSGGAVQSTSGAFEVRLPDRDWYQLPSKTLSQDDSALELARSDQSSWLIAYETHLPQDTLDSIIEGRRQTIAAASRIRFFHEKRSFLSGEELTPQSVSEYRTGDDSLQSGYVVLTVRREQRFFELVAWTGSWARDAEPLRKLVNSFKLRRQGKK